MSKQDVVSDPAERSEVPSNFVDVIKGFDSHERGILFQWAAGAPFCISAKLRESLEDKLRFAIPSAPFVAMDYTLDWLYAHPKSTNCVPCGPPGAQVRARGADRLPPTLGTPFAPVPPTPPTTTQPCTW